MQRCCASSSSFADGRLGQALLNQANDTPAGALLGRIMIAHGVGIVKRCREFDKWMQC